MSQLEMDSLRDSIAEVRAQVTDLQTRTARLEGSFSGFQERLDRIYATLLGLAATLVVGLIGILVAILTHHVGG
ncbi:MAG: hypothetical protein M0Z47_10730 [Actinomycetota bacterium]|nr:hypothetical protein [Actinomycetota bacterium]